MLSGLPFNQLALSDVYGVYTAVEQVDRTTIHPAGQLSEERMQRWITSSCSGVRVSELYNWMANSQLDGDALRYRCMIQTMGPDFREAWTKHQLPDQARNPEQYDEQYDEKIEDDREWYEAIHDLRTLVEYKILPPTSTYDELKRYRESEDNVALAKAIVKRISERNRAGSAGVGSKRVMGLPPRDDVSSRYKGPALQEIVDNVFSGSMNAQLLAEYMASGTAIEILLSKTPQVPRAEKRQLSERSL